MTDTERVEVLRDALQEMVAKVPRTAVDEHIWVCAYCHESISHRSDCVVRTALEALRDTADRPSLRVAT